MNTAPTPNKNAGMAILYAGLGLLFGWGMLSDTGASDSGNIVIQGTVILHGAGLVLAAAHAVDRALRAFGKRPLFRDRPAGGSLMLFVIAASAGHALAPLVPASWAVPLWTVAPVAATALAAAIVCRARGHAFRGAAVVAALLFIAPAMGDMASRW